MFVVLYLSGIEPYKGQAMHKVMFLSQQDEQNSLK